MHACMRSGTACLVAAHMWGCGFYGREKAVGVCCGHWLWSTEIAACEDVRVPSALTVTFVCVWKCCGSPQKVDMRT